MEQMRDNATQVLEGTAEGGLRWVVVAYGDREDLYTMLRVYSGDELVVPGSGFGGPPLYPGDVLNEWRGRTDELPYFVMARTVPEADRVVATTDLGADVTLALSAPVEQFGVRFAAAALPAGHRPGSIRAERDGQELANRPQPMPPSRGPGRT
ncbi:MAG: hypothetical protein ACLQFR_30985 [Streptosporangiaceae bacterium]